MCLVLRRDPCAQMLLCWLGLCLLCLVLKSCVIVATRNTHGSIQPMKASSFLQPYVALSLRQDAALSGLEVSAIKKKAYYEIQAAAEAIESR